MLKDHTNPPKYLKATTDLVVRALCTRRTLASRKRLDRPSIARVSTAFARPNGRMGP